MRVLITGVAGFAGRHLAALCVEQGAAVTGLGRRPEPEADPPEGVEYLSADLEDPAAAREAVATASPERVFHLAAESSVSRSWTAPEETVRGNLTSTLHLLEALCSAAPDAAVLVACSGEEYGPVPSERLPVTEDEPLRPQNPYAASKAMSDLLAGFYGDARGLRLVRTRAFNHAGPGQEPTFVVSDFARQIAEAEAAGGDGVVIETGNVEVRRDFTDVRDVVRAYALASERAEPGVYNVCSGRSVPVADILAALDGATELEVKQRTDPAKLREHEVMEIRGSNEKLAQAVGWGPEIPLEQTLRDALDWWRERTGVEVGR
jgi:GDP-4-dehydro-6-deoxy-D-mannose reductase